MVIVAVAELVPVRYCRTSCSKGTPTMMSWLPAFSTPAATPTNASGSDSVGAGFR
jgi:hypothetical protein